MKQTIFDLVPVNEEFFDRYYTGEWLIKIDHEVARCQDGLLVLVSGSCPVEVRDSVKI